MDSCVYHALQVRERIWFTVLCLLLLFFFCYGFVLIIWRCMFVWVCVCVIHWLELCVQGKCKTDIDKRIYQTMSWFLCVIFLCVGVFLLLSALYYTFATTNVQGAHEIRVICKHSCEWSSQIVNGWVQQQGNLSLLMRWRDIEQVWWREWNVNDWTFRRIHVWWCGHSCMTQKQCISVYSRISLFLTLSLSVSLGRAKRGLFYV